MLTQRRNSKPSESMTNVSEKSEQSATSAQSADSAQSSDSAQSATSAHSANAASSQNSAEPVKAPRKIPVKKLVLICVGLAVAAIVGVIAYNYFSTFQETDDAYITAHIDPISSRVEANVERIHIDDNQHVKAGQLLIELDSRDFDRQVDRARAELSRVQSESIVSARNIDLAAKSAQAARLNARGDSTGNDALIEQSMAAIEQARYAMAEQKDVLRQKQAELLRASQDYSRYEKLESEGVITTSERDSSRRDYDVARSAVDAAKRAIDQKKMFIEQTTHQLNIAKSKRVQSTGLERTADSRSIEVDVSKLQNDVSQAAIKEAQTKLADALLKQSYCKIYAPVSGRVGRKNVELGQRVDIGARLFTLTEDELWVVANYKENQLEKMEVGQPVEIKVDILPGRKFDGVVESFSPGSGAQFTLLPPDNATGNFTKIVQRVPVKILFKGSLNEIRKKLVPGLSVIATVKVK